MNCMNYVPGSLKVNKYSFEDFMMDQFLKEEPTVLDDDIADGFDFFLSGLNIEDWLKYGDLYLSNYKNLISDDGR